MFMQHIYGNLINSLIVRDESNLPVDKDISKLYSVDVVNCELDKHITAKQTDDHDCHTPNGPIVGYLNHTSTQNAVSRDVNDVTKVVGFWNPPPN